MREELARLLKNRPFQPIQLYVTDGSIYEIRHPEMIIPTVYAAHIGVPAKGIEPPIMEFVDIVSWQHIVKIDFIAPPVAAAQM